MTVKFVTEIGDTDAKTIIQTKEKYNSSNNSKVPLLVIRHIGNFGTLIWFNSADKSDELARSLNEPQKEVLLIIFNTIKYSQEIKEYYRKSVDIVEKEATIENGH
ncbi:MAG: hypothetical protein IPP71_06640 [Bacteroidetes bacterium]|nr:hypothetical protein [Bacteroidota bacterium]